MKALKMILVLLILVIAMRMSILTGTPDSTMYQGDCADFCRDIHNFIGRGMSEKEFSERGEEALNSRMLSDKWPSLRKEGDVWKASFRVSDVSITRDEKWPNVIRISPANPSFEGMDIRHVGHRFDSQKADDPELYGDQENSKSPSP